MRREHLYLQDILEACDTIQAFLEGMDAAAFLASELHKAAVLQKLAVIGEAESATTKHENTKVDRQDAGATKRLFQNSSPPSRS